MKRDSSIIVSRAPVEGAMPGFNYGLDLTVDNAVVLRVYGPQPMVDDLVLAQLTEYLKGKEL